MAPSAVSGLQALLQHEPLHTSDKTWRRGCIELMRLHKSISGNSMMFWPCAWGLTMAGYAVGLPAKDLAVQTVMFAIGSTFLHSAACVLNDICDVEFDRQVERTKDRPLPAGVVSITQAVVLLTLLTIATISMLLFTNYSAALYGIMGVFPFHTLYPFMKRWTWWPQAWLGLTVNWGFIVAWIAVAGDIKTDVVGFLLLGSTCWTIVYDTMYACQDRKDDIRVGIKSTAVLFGKNIRPILMGFTAVFLMCLVQSGICNEQGVAYFVIGCGGATVHVIWLFLTWKVDIPEDGGAKYQSSGLTGLIIWMGMLVDYWLRMEYRLRD